ncbi:MAG: uracil-DNA glycosylase [Planctomycetaceae bacterium]|nr:uracil-DNA glycosylase [Planctomycetaceae bacterium]
MSPAKRTPTKRTPTKQTTKTTKQPAAGGADAWAELNDEIVACERCPRLIAHCQQVAAEKRRAYEDHDYWGRPVPNLFAPIGSVDQSSHSGASKASFAPTGTIETSRSVLIVGLAPGAHGANRTGRMFTGDRSGDWLFRALQRGGLASQATSVDRNDGLTLIDLAITAVCHCAPPDNKPLPEEVQNCREYLVRTFELCQPNVILALGKIAWDAMTNFYRHQPEAFLRTSTVAFGQAPSTPKAVFGHGRVVRLGDRWMVGSYHPSQQNTFTKRLTEAMLDAVIAQVRELAEPNSVSKSQNAH